MPPLSQRPGHRRFYTILRRPKGDEAARGLQGASFDGGRTRTTGNPVRWCGIVASSPARLEQFDVGELVRTPTDVLGTDAA